MQVVRAKPFKQLRCVIDIEANDVRNPTVIWCIVCREIDDAGKTLAVRIFSDTKTRVDILPLASFRAYALGVSHWIGHNIISYDTWHIFRLLGVWIDYRKCVDTLVVSRLLDYNRPGEHSLSELARSLGETKTEFAHWVDFDKYFFEGLDYCVNDTYINTVVYNSFSKYVDSSRWNDSIRLEHFIQYLAREMTINGFTFNSSSARELLLELNSKRDNIDKELVSLFPVRVVPIREVIPSATKFGTINLKDFRFLGASPDLSSYSVGAGFTRIRFEPPNLGSNHQLIDYLIAAGWKPVDKTEGHKKALQEKNEAKYDHYVRYGWKVNEENLSTLPDDAPEGPRKLAERILLSSRIGDLEEWLACYDPATGRIHGSYLGIGSWTHRMAHREPNTANIVGVKTRSGTVALYGKEMRQMWAVPLGRWLIGTDAKGIQLRILAHYINDSAFTAAVCEGDIHSLNAEALGGFCNGRGPAKTFIYAWLLGAGVAKVAAILSCTTSQARQSIERFVSYYPGLKRIKQSLVPQDARRGYFEGLDGRLVKCNSEHLMLAGYLQNGEKVIMAKAAEIWNQRLQKENFDGHYFLVDFVHDEWQTECIGTREQAEYIGKVQCEALQEAGRSLNLNCPMDGNFTIGKDWSCTH